MALSEQTVSKHNIKRAEAFARLGLGTADIQYAHPSFLGRDNSIDGSVCELCGQQHLRWLFSIRFEEPHALVALAKVDTDIIRTEEVNVNPVGSKCIQDWLDAVPESMEKLEVLKRWEREMSACKKAMKAYVVEQLCLEAGYETPQDAFEAYQSLATSRDGRRAMRKVMDYREVRRFDRNARKVRYKTGSRKTVKDWLENLKDSLEALENLPPLPEPPQPTRSPFLRPVNGTPTPPPTPPATDPDVDALLERGRLAWANRSVLDKRHQDAFEDIGKKVTKHGKFITPRQRKYYTDLLRKLEKGA